MISQNLGGLQHGGQILGIEAKSAGDSSVSKFSNNWMHQGGRGPSLVLRVDCKRKATFKDVAKNIGIVDNVAVPLPGGPNIPKMIVKGERHSVVRNTLINTELQIVREWGCCLCGMNDKSIFEHILASSFRSPGAELPPGHKQNCDLFPPETFTKVKDSNDYYRDGRYKHVLPWPKNHADAANYTQAAMLERRKDTTKTLHKNTQHKGFPEQFRNNMRVVSGVKANWDGGKYREELEAHVRAVEAKKDLCDVLRDCTNLDFRPREPWTQPPAGTMSSNSGGTGTPNYGAYAYRRSTSQSEATPFDSYWIPGRRLPYPEPFTVSSRNPDKPGEDLALIFRPACEGEIHRVKVGRGCRLTCSNSKISAAGTAGTAAAGSGSDIPGVDVANLVLDVEVPAGKNVLHLNLLTQVRGDLKEAVRLGPPKDLPADNTQGMFHWQVEGCLSGEAQVGLGYDFDRFGVQYKGPNTPVYTKPPPPEAPKTAPTTTTTYSVNV